MKATMNNFFFQIDKVVNKIKLVNSAYYFKTWAEKAFIFSREPV